MDFENNKFVMMVVITVRIIYCSNIKDYWCIKCWQCNQSYCSVNRSKNITLKVVKNDKK